MTKRRVNHAARARSPIVQEILNILAEEKGWVDKETLDAKAGKLLPKEDAIYVFHYRHCDGHKHPEKKPNKKHSNYGVPEKEKIERGRSTQVMLNCITLFQTGKIEQRGRGSDKQYRLVKKPKKSSE